MSASAESAEAEVSPAVPEEPEMEADAVLASRLSGSARVLAGLLAAGLLDAAGQPRKLPAYLFPHLDAEAVRVVWDAGLVVGFRAGRVAGRSRWDAEELAAARGALESAGWEALAGAVAEAVGVARRAARAEGPDPVGGEDW
ncbi:MAG TPA: hypothetical protein VFY14_20625 [Streptomyces sp.]|nr:hypothetical protein [Streptomyces sp.]